MSSVLSRRVLAALLICQISGMFLPLRVIAKTTTDPIASGPKRTLVLPLLGPGSKPDAVSKVADTLRDELARQNGLTVLDKVASDGVLQNLPNLSAEAPVGNLDRYLDQAKEFYRNFQFKEAVSLLENTIEGYRSSSGSLTENFALVDAYLLLGNVEAGKNDLRKAHEAFREAVRLNPDREISERDFPPKTVAAFQKARDEFLKKSKPATLEIVSVPSKAELFLNGEAKGLTPAKLERFAAGEHFLLLKSPGYKPVALKLQVPAEGQRRKIELEKIDGGGPSSKTGLSVADLKDVNEQVRIGSALGKQVKVDKVVFVSLEEVGWNNKISARMIDTHYRASHKVQSVEVLDLPKDTRPASQVIAKQLADASRLDLAKDPKKYADSDVLVIGNKKKRAWYKSPWLWGAIGIAVAGGATGALLLGKGGASAGDGSASVSLSGPAGRTP